jgi:hypothetical protein
MPSARTGGASRREMAASASSGQACRTAGIGSRRCRPRTSARSGRSTRSTNCTSLQGSQNTLRRKPCRRSMPKVSRGTTAAATGLDSLAQFCGLSLPTFNQRGWIMSSSVYATSSSASTASTDPTSRQQKRVDFLTRYCGLSLPTLFKRIGTITADANRFHRLSPHAGCARVAGALSEPTLPGRPPTRSPERACPSAFTGAVDHLLRRHRPLCRPDLPERLHRCGSTTGNGWRSPSRQAGPSPPNIAGDNP